jgi:hypothetical protein
MDGEYIEKRRKKLNEYLNVRKKQNKKLTKNKA